MRRKFETILYKLITDDNDGEGFKIISGGLRLNVDDEDVSNVAKNLTIAFLIVLSGSRHPDYSRAYSYLKEMSQLPEWGDVARFYLNGIDVIPGEIEKTAAQESDFSEKLESLYEWCLNANNLKNKLETREKLWAVFFPEAQGVLADLKQHERLLRQKRTVRITETAKETIQNPARQILFTSNVLLTVPSATKSLKELSLSDFVKNILQENSGQPQQFWYDHPIPVGVAPENNEVLYGLNGLEQAVEFEKKRGNVAPHQKLTCVLSVSVTHPFLHQIARAYLQEELAKQGSFRHLNVFVFTEDDTQKIVEKILKPAAKNFFSERYDENVFQVFGVDGEYGRHYSFLKAISVFWSIFADPQVKATFKIDLDQVFPQEELIKETGLSAFEHFQTPLWNAKGVDAFGQPVELGMIAGALVNEKDIRNSLFTPDVPYPDRSLNPDEYIFFSQLPQALSTRAEMMTRYGSNGLDGKTQCIQRIHVTGGTNGILVGALKKFRPFTPSFFGRAEDQAYLFSTMIRSDVQLAYLHKDGLIMRHDKEAFAQEAINASQVGKLIGDYIRILYFSNYARVLDSDYRRIKERVDPFTGCFISRIPKTVVYLRFALKALSFFQNGDSSSGVNFVTNGAERISRVLHFVEGENSPLRQQYEKERRSWELYYDTLVALEKALKRQNDFAMKLKREAKRIVDECQI